MLNEIQSKSAQFTIHIREDTNLQDDIDTNLIENVLHYNLLDKH